MSGGYHKVLVVSAVALQFAVKPINAPERTGRNLRKGDDGEKPDTYFRYTFAWPYLSKQGFETARLDAQEFYNQAKRDYGNIATVELIPGKLSEAA